MLRSILVICVGNICRSPMAEALFSKVVKDLELNITVSSAGTAALVNYSADSMAQELMREKGFDISSHQARQLSPELLLNADLILTMEAGQQYQIEGMLPSIRGRVHRLGKWGEFDVPDPYRRSRIAFENSLFMIEQGINEWQRKLWI